MRDCGNRAKASRFYKKKKKLDAGSANSKTTPTLESSTSSMERHLL
jgi:hypothetical protein